MFVLLGLRDGSDIARHGADMGMAGVECGAAPVEDTKGAAITVDDDILEEQHINYDRDHPKMEM